MYVSGSLEDRRARAPRRPLAAICAVALLAGHAQVQAQSSYVLCGVVDAGVELTTSANGNEQRVISGGLMGSRWGLSGSEDLGGGLRTLFRLEAGFDASDGSISQGGRAFGRESSVWLSSIMFGTVQAGRLPTPYYRAQSAVDAFGYGQPGSVVATTRIVNGAASQILPAAVNARADKAVGYTTPTWNGFSFSALASVDEQSPTLGHGYGLSARYADKQATAVAARNRQKSSSTGTGEAEAYVLGGSYDLGVARVFAGYTVETNGCSNCTGIFARVAGVAGTDESEFRIGNRNGSSYALGTGSAQQSAPMVVDPSRFTTVAAGIRHSV